MKYHMGIDIGGTDIKIGILDETNRIICRHSEPMRARLPFDEMMRLLADAAQGMMRQCGLAAADFPYAGVGIPAFVDARTENLVYANNTDWVNVPLKKTLQQRLEMPVLVENDANCALAAEVAAGAAQGVANVVMLTLGTGVGGGVLINHKLYSGADGMGTELGHMQLKYGGEMCTCGIRGCFEAYASVTGLIRQAKRAMRKHPDSMMHTMRAAQGKVNGKLIFDAAKTGDAAALQVVDNYIGYVAAGIGSLANIFRSELALIGGGLSNAGEFLLAPLQERANAFVFAHELIGGPRVAAATMGNDAGLVGAALLGEL